ncbi:MAG: outer membrane lipoprotein-sorting protein [Sphaerochaetaceae bacterium]|nr:outer membrane lipoprotein-sorting protein [Sphaerochaetaceae bacterium]
MKKRLMTACCLLLALGAPLAADANQLTEENYGRFERMLLDSLRNSKEQGSCGTTFIDMTFIQGMIYIPYGKEVRATSKKNLEATEVTLNLVSFRNHRYNLFAAKIYPTYVMTVPNYPKVGRNSISMTYNANSRKIVRGRIKTVIFTYDDAKGEYRLLPKYKVVSAEERKLDGVPCWAVGISNSPTLETAAVYWIEKERCVRLREDLFSPGGVLTQRIDYFSYQRLSEGTYVEDMFSIWNPLQRYGTALYWTIDLMEGPIPDRMFDENQLEKYATL